MYAGECFGLLGVNGAGKTTTFSMLTGDATISSGDAFLGGTSVARGAAGARQHLVGYCPQFHALIDQMTVRETLWMYARLRGIHRPDIGRVVEKMIDQLALRTYADRQAGRLRYTWRTRSQWCGRPFAQNGGSGLVIRESKSVCLCHIWRVATR